MKGAIACLALAAAAALLPAHARAACPGPRLLSSAPPPAARPWLDASLPASRRADLLLAEMALEEKIDLATGERCLAYGYYNAPNERLGIPALTMTDGPAGIRIPWRRVNGGRATQLPAPISVAASWDVALAAAQGDVLGAEAFATGHNVMLGPTLDVARNPLAGRTFEGLGEDPLLVSRMGAALVEGIQRHPVLATAKHWAAYGREDDRWTVDARVDERTLREVYLRPFEGAVRAGVAGVMCGFNRVNGVYACEDDHLLNGILKGDLGFDGFVLSDWGAIHGTREAALGGLDQELAFEKYFGARLLDAVRRGEIPERVVEDKARRILRVMFRGGLFEHPAADGALPVKEDGERSRRIAEGGAVLLRNEGGILPLSADALGSIAVIGADADDVSAQGGGAARVEPTYAVSPLAAIRARAGARVRVEHAEGTDPVQPGDLVPGPVAIPSSVLSPPGDPSGRGLRVEWWPNPRFEGEPGEVDVTRRPIASAGFFSYQSVNASSEAAPPYALSQFSARFTGTITAPASGEYVLTLTSRGEGRVWLDGALVIDHSGPHELASRSATVRLAAGERHDLRIDYAATAPSIGVATDRGGEVKLAWQPPPGAVAPDVRAAADLAARSDVAVVVVRDYGTEERDRHELALPAGQDALVEAVAAANPRTVVVLTTGQPASMPWLAAVPGVLQAWYAGQEQGTAIAGLLFGDVNPSGKLPITFPRALEDTPGAAAPAADGVDTYAEGVLVGYRWYDAKGLEPLFPFGFGLSYTEFRYGELSVVGGPTAGEGTGRARVAFTVTNAGARAGAEVAQVYVGACGADAPARQLAGFAKVPLAAGESRRVEVELAPEALSRWSETTRAWETPQCDLPVFVGASSRDLPLRASIHVAGDGTIAPGSSSGGGGGGGGAGGCSGGAGGAASMVAPVVAWWIARRRRRSPGDPRVPAAA